MGLPGGARQDPQIPEGSQTLSVHARLLGSHVHGHGHPLPNLLAGDAGMLPRALGSCPRSHGALGSCPGGTGILCPVGLGSCPGTPATCVALGSHPGDTDPTLCTVEHWDFTLRAQGSYPGATGVLPWVLLSPGISPCHGSRNSIPDSSSILTALALASSRAVTQRCRSTSELALRW